MNLTASVCIHRATFLSLLSRPFLNHQFSSDKSERLAAFYALCNRQVDALVDHIQGLYIDTI